MPIKPTPYTVRCPKCGYKKTIAPKSDTDLLATSHLCPKCKVPMHIVKTSPLDRLKGIFFS